MDTDQPDTYRACFWVSADGQAEILLTGREVADLEDDELIEVGRFEIERAGGDLAGGHLTIGVWTD